jgi:hypothetical protein
MGKMVPLPPPRNNEELLEQIEMLEKRRGQLEAQTLFLIALAFAAAILIIVTMVMFG